jgi:hypothetical protein
MNHPGTPARRSYWTLSIGLLMLTAVLLFVAACNEEDLYTAPTPTPVPAGDESTAGTTNPQPDEANEDDTGNPGNPEPQPTPTRVVDSEPDPTATPEPEGSDDTGENGDGEAEPTPTTEPAPEPEPQPEPMNIPDAAYLPNMTQIYQTWNNCSAASACMLLSHYGVHRDQEEVRPFFRPNEDIKHGKSSRIVEYFNQQGFRALVMHGGDVETLQAFLANDIPVIVQQWLELEGDPIGHYRVVRGYDHNAGVFRVNDSMYGADVRYSYAEFNRMWKGFSYRYIPVYPAEKEEIVQRILGDELKLEVNRQRALERYQREVEQNPNDAELWFSLGTNLFELGRYQEAVEAYERAASIGLPPKMLWYQYWPPAAYNNIGQHERAIELAGQQIATANTFGDMRYERGRAYEALGQPDRAIAEYRRAATDDPLLTKAQDALNRLGAN